MLSIKRLWIFVFQCLFCGSILGAQDYWYHSADGIVLDNGLIKRELDTSNGSIGSTGLWMPGDSLSFLERSREFSFLLDDMYLDGNSGWKVSGMESIRDENGGQGMKLMLSGSVVKEGLSVELNYLLYPALPLVRKWIRFENTGKVYLKIEALNVEDLQSVFSHVNSMVLHDYARMKHLGSYVGDWNDPVLVVHDQSFRKGMALGNEAPGVLKRTAWHTELNNLEAGLTHPGQDHPFRLWLGPGEHWESPCTFLCLYGNSDDGFAVVDGPVNDFIRLHLQPQVIRQKEKPLFVYNTWNPFRTYVSDSLVRLVAKAAADCGIQEFIIDDGWQVNREASSSQNSWGNNYGDWQVDEEKFPGGLKPTFDYIRSLGMKPGIWMSLGSATEDAAVYREHPEWFVRDQEGKPGNLHGYGEEMHTACYGSEWPDYIYSVISHMVEKYGLAYTKLDFAIASSAYVNDPRISGCYATDHPYHRDREESFIVIYERLLELFDRLHRTSPELFIDCTFETAGKLQLMDYAIARSAEGNWLSNFEEASPTGPLRIRHMAWWRSPALPAASLVIGNTAMDDPQFEFALKSLIGTLPIVLGDPRELSERQRARIRKWSLWMQDMQGKYDYMSFRRDLPGFGEPAEGKWDGWMRMNKDSGRGGIVGVFRQGAVENCRQVVLKDLLPDMEYSVRVAPEGDLLLRATGMELMEKGFPAEISALYEGLILEVGLD